MIYIMNVRVLGEFLAYVCMYVAIICSSCLRFDRIRF